MLFSIGTNKKKTKHKTGNDIEIDRMDGVDYSRLIILNIVGLVWRVGYQLSDTVI